MNATATREEVLARIEHRLGTVNGRRRERKVSLADAIGCVRAVAEGDPWCYQHGGSVVNAYKYRAVTSYVLAARVGGRICLGITTADAKATSPGRAWSQLQPWRKYEGPRGDAPAKWAAWSRDADVIELAGPEVDAILEGEGANP